MSESECCLAPPRAKLPRASFSAPQAELSRAIGRGCLAQLPALEAQLSLHAAPCGEPPDWDDPLLLNGAFGAIELAQGPRLVRALSGIDLGAAPPDAAFEEWLQAAAAGRLEGTPLGCCDRLARAHLPDEQEATTLRVTLKSASHAISTHARAAAPVWLDFLSRSQWSRERLPDTECLAFALEAPLRIARHALPAALFRTLAAGDVIVPDSPLFTCEGEGALSLGAFELRVGYRAPGTLEILSLEPKLNADEFDESVDEAEADADFEINPEPLPELADGAEPADSLAGLDGVTVTLEFELGRARMSLGELRALGPGTIVECKGGSPAAIAIRAGGRAVGRGEAVEVDGKLAIRITQWGAR